MKAPVKFFVTCMISCSCALFAQEGEWAWNASGQENPSGLEMMVMRLETRHRMVFEPSAAGSNQNQLQFRVLRPLTRDDARRIVVDCLQEFDRVGSLYDKCRHPMRHALTKADGITLTLLIYGDDGLPAIAPALGEVKASTKKITYGYRQSTYDIACRHFEEEGFQEGYDRSWRENTNLGLSRMPL